MKKWISFLLPFTLTTMLSAQDQLPGQSDSIAKENSTMAREIVARNQARQKWRAVILPAGLITYGFISLNSDGLKDFDEQLKSEIREHNSHFHTPIDNYLQYAPAATAFGLKAFGVRSRDNFRDMSMIYLLSNAMMGITVQSIKHITRIQRPDGFGHNAFPSGHTATAFVSASFLDQEYKNVSPWIGIGGYMMAGTTAVLRMYNNKHWFRDLLPGAGLGILSTRVAYWIYPAIKQKLFKKNPGDSNTLIMPYYENNSAGLSLVYHFPQHSIIKRGNITRTQGL